MNAKVWYLFQSGFAIKTEKHFLVFDYWLNKPAGGTLEQGVVSPAEIRDLDTIVFVSHSHGDHYNPDILKWRDEIPKCRYVFSDDIAPVPNAQMIGPNMRAEQEDFSVETLKSTDIGVAFIVEIDGLRIYHAGDLNWWHWEGEPDAYNREMAANYKGQIDIMNGRTIDLAFVPVDPRLGKQYCWGINYLMEYVDVKKVFPMHFGRDISVVERLLAEPLAAAYRDRIVPISQRGRISTEK